MTGEADLVRVGRTPVLQQSTSGVVALVFGILGFVALPLIGSVLAVVFGHRSRSEAAQRPDLYLDDYGRIGRILGWIGIALTAGAFAVGALLIGFFFVVPS